MSQESSFGEFLVVAKGDEGVGVCRASQSRKSVPGSGTQVIFLDTGRDAFVMHSLLNTRVSGKLIEDI